MQAAQEAEERFKNYILQGEWHTETNPRHVREGEHFVEPNPYNEASAGEYDQPRFVEDAIACFRQSGFLYLKYPKENAFAERNVLLVVESCPKFVQGASEYSDREEELLSVSGDSLQINKPVTLDLFNRLRATFPTIWQHYSDAFAIRHKDSSLILFRHLSETEEIVITGTAEKSSTTQDTLQSTVNYYLDTVEEFFGRQV